MITYFKTNLKYLLELICRINYNGYGLNSNRSCCSDAKSLIWQQIFKENLPIAISISVVHN